MSTPCWLSFEVKAEHERGEDGEMHTRYHLIARWNGDADHIQHQSFLVSSFVGEHAHRDAIVARRTCETLETCRYHALHTHEQE